LPLATSFLTLRDSGIVSLVPASLAADLVLLALVGLGIGVLTFYLLTRSDPAWRPSSAGKISATPFGLIDLGVVFGLGLILWVYARRENLPPSPYAESEPGFFAVTTVLIVAYLSLARRIRVGEAFGLHRPELLPLATGAAAALVMGAGAIFLAGSLAPHPGLTEDVRPIAFIEYLGFLVFAPLAFEIVFRGFVYGTVKRYSERFLAATVASLLFSVCTICPDGFSTRFLFGLCLCLAYEITGSLWVPLVAHAGIRAFLLLEMNA